MADKDSDVMILVRLPKSHRVALKQIALDEGTTVTSLMKQAVIKLIKQNV
jgi:putative ubiquitin-RnfH superfamily antitoxin RatB of RatAB toxin-antitoxin module